MSEVEKKGLKIIVENSSYVKQVSTSRVYLTEILENFLTNAIEYTQQGSITLSVKNAPDAQDGIIFSVADTGYGIGDSDKDKIFTKFYRAEDYKTKNTKGTGLGLYLTLKLAKAIDGKIWFISELNKGSTFFLQIPTIGIEADNDKAESTGLSEKK